MIARFLALGAALGGLACSSQPSCKLEDAATITARYAARMRIECDGYSFDECPEREAIEDDRKARLEASCPTK